MTGLILGLLIGVPLGVGVETWLRYSRNRVSADITAIVDATREPDPASMPPDELEAHAEALTEQAIRQMGAAAKYRMQAQVARCRETKALQRMWDASGDQ